MSFAQNNHSNFQTAKVSTTRVSKGSALAYQTWWAGKQELERDQH